MATIPAGRFPPEFERFLIEMQQAGYERLQREAEADPLKHKLARVFPPGVGSNYRYWEARNGRGSRVRFCYAVNRNVAGFYLTWREVETAKAVKRDQWASRRTRKAAAALALKRHRAMKAKLA